MNENAFDDKVVHPVWAVVGRPIENSWRNKKAIIGVTKNYTAIDQTNDSTTWKSMKNCSNYENMIMMYGHRTWNPQKHNKNNTNESPKEEEFRLPETRSCSPFLFIS